MSGATVLLVHGAGAGTGCTGSSPHASRTAASTIQCADPAASKAFYKKVLAPIGGKTIMTFDDVHGMGVDFPCFGLGPVGEAGPPHKDWALETAS